MKLSHFTRRARSAASAALLLGLASLAGAASEAQFTKGPCPFVADSVVAKAFALPAGAALEHTNVKLGGVSCSFNWEGGRQRLVAKVRMQEEKTLKRASERFERSTRSMSAEDMARAAELLRQRMEKSGQSSSTQAAGKALVGAATREPIVFEDVGGVGEQARYDAAHEGTLVVRQGKHIYRISAYYGAGTPEPGNLARHKQWLQDTSAERKQQAIGLARAILQAGH
ncbi:MAG: hypothetical protein LC123_10525 [Burkholderiales bacterium]|uniref:hypothetical protein n=1 Tax=Comamonas sp. NLF-1-9 TaxID=2853163 RepID=UPI001C475CBD|nr:hypothetical protein [Comamonas sp. NLF-1-9]MCZ2420262.1 hypothetical protein [Burkholderiales bacterium]QXL83208.1 hypothetical protein KUD94_07955 [Comamonas sp. NLF-1-9]